MRTVLSEEAAAVTAGVLTFDADRRLAEWRTGKMDRRSRKIPLLWILKKLPVSAPPVYRRCGEPCSQAHVALCSRMLEDMDPPRVPRRYVVVSIRLRLLHLCQHHDLRAS
jgi:hypothetical protein